MTHIAFFGVFIIAMAIVAVAIFNTKNSNTGSWISRLDGYRAAFYAFKESPIFGLGFRDASDVTGYLTLRTGFLNAVASVLAQGGIMLLLLAFFCFIFRITKNEGNAD